jgi:Ca2+-binding RTX toxin-like protein
LRRGNGAVGVDILSGADGDDMLLGGTGTDTVNGGGRSDFASYQSSAAAVTVNL